MRKTMIDAEGEVYDSTRAPGGRGAPTEVRSGWSRRERRLGGRKGCWSSWSRGEGGSRVE